jgi:putative ABC transport system permease protein
VLTIALGIGATTAVFTLVNAVLIKGLPYVESDRLVTLYETDLRASGEEGSVSVPNFIDWQREVRSVDGMASYAFGPRLLLETGRIAQPIIAATVSWNYFEVLGIPAALGRSFLPADDLEGAARAIVISDSLWRETFNRDPSAVGQSVSLSRVSWTIVGVMPPGFVGPPDSSGLLDEVQVWRPLRAAASAWMPGMPPPTRQMLNDRGIGWMGPIIARLHPGVSLRQAQQELDSVAARLAEQFPAANSQRGAIIAPMETAFFGRMDRLVAVLFAAVGVVLLIACVNLANLMLVRGGTRQREWALRNALGAARGRIARLVLTESLVISTVGGAVGALLAAWMVDALVALSPIPFPSFVDLRLNLPVLGFTFAVCLLSGMLFGALPAISAERIDLLRALKVGSHGATEGVTRMHRPLVAGQLALALVLLVGAGLLFRTLRELQAFDPGFEWRGLLAVRVSRLANTPSATQADADGALFRRNLLERVRALHGIGQAALSWDVPLTDMWGPALVQIEGRNEAIIRTRQHRVTPGYFRTMGVPLRMGRDFEATDDQSASQPVAIISRRLAERHWPDASPLHQRLRLGTRMLEIVGVVGDVQHVALLESAIAEPDIYVPIDQTPPLPAFAVVIRSAGNTTSLIAAIRQMLSELDRAIDVVDVRTGEQMFAAQIARQRFTSALLALFALAAALLTMIGVYGVTAYSVNLLTRQIGIRMALGADRVDILRLILGNELTFIGAGIFVGILTALLVTRALSTLVFGVTPKDPVTFAVATTILGAIALIACVIPARRAVSVDPVAALRAD